MNVVINNYQVRVMGLPTTTDFMQGSKPQKSLFLLLKLFKPSTILNEGFYIDSVLTKSCVMQTTRIIDGFSACRIIGLAISV